MNNFAAVGTTFRIGKVEYVIESVEPVDERLVRTRECMRATGKDLATYTASLVLASGRKSKRGGIFYRFTDSGNFISIV